MYSRRLITELLSHLLLQGSLGYACAYSVVPHSVNGPVAFSEISCGIMY